jgi:hypothetical protein
VCVCVCVFVCVKIMCVHDNNPLTHSHARHTYTNKQLHGRHGKRITCGNWNSFNKLALAGEDKMLTISNASGKLLDQAELELNPVELRFSEQVRMHELLCV